MQIIRKPLFHLSHQMFNGNYWSLYKYVMSNEKKSREELMKEQEKKVRKIIKYSYDNIPYYHDQWKKINIHPDDIKRISDLEKLPIIDKNDIRSNLEKFYPSKSNIKYFTQSTGGTTGTPLTYRVDNRNRMLGGVLLYRGWGYAGYEISDKMVFLAGASLDVRSGKYQKLIHRISRNIIKLSSFDMDEDRLTDYIKVINKEKPEFIRGYPSALYFLSNFIIKNSIEMVPVKGIFTTSEQIFPVMREKIMEAFQTEVFDGYGLNDGCLSTFECKEHSGMHIDTERGLLEVVDKNNQSINNEEGNIVATSLENYSMPFIRYDTGDNGVVDLDYECDCGRGYPVLKELKGRSVDIFITPEKNIVHGWFFLFIFWKYNKGIKKYQVIQKNIDNIEIIIVKEHPYNENNINDILNIIQSKSNKWNIKIIYADDIKNKESGKYKFIINEMDIAKFY